MYDLITNPNSNGPNTLFGKTGNFFIWMIEISREKIRKNDQNSGMIEFIKIWCDLDPVKLPSSGFYPTIQRGPIIIISVDGIGDII